MRVFMIKVLMLIILQIIRSSGSNSKLLMERIKNLKTGINSASNFTEANYADVIGKKLDEINKKLATQTQDFDKLDRKTSELSTGMIEDLHDAFTRNKTALTGERIRRDIPKTENALTEEWCLKSLNRGEELLSRMEQSEELIKSEIGFHLGELNKEQSALQTTLNDTKAKVENIELLVMKLTKNLRHLFGDSSCKELHETGKRQTGVYTLRNGIEVFCDQTTDGGGWTVFQRRLNGEVDFYRNWTEYRNGFGDLNGEFWLGNEKLNILTETNKELIINIEDFDGNKAYAWYSKFKIHSEEEKYKLEVGGYKGNAKDGLRYHDEMAFSTFDSDNDVANNNCAIRHHGAWWYKACQVSNLNGQYFNESGKIDTKGITWRYWKYEHFCLKSVEIKFR